MQDVSEATGYNLSVRNVFSGLNLRDAADWIADELDRRPGER